MIWNLLSDSNNSWSMYIMLGAIVVIFVVMMVYSRRSQKKRQQETMDMLNAIKPGNKVKTIGGICGVVVEVCKDDNTFVLETGTEASGKSYIKFDMQAVYQTDAKPEKAEAAPAVTETKADETPAEEVKAEEQPVDETPVEENKENE